MSLRLDLTTKLTEVSRKEGKKNSSVKKGRPKFLMSYWEPDFYSVLYKEFFHFSMVACYVQEHYHSRNIADSYLAITAYLIVPVNGPTIYP